jgi:hypothetical protein
MKHGDERQRLSWPSEQDKAWAEEFTFALVRDHSAPDGLRERVLTEVHEMAVESGEPVRELVGDPRGYAATVAAERIGEAHRGSLDLDDFTPGGRFTAALLLAGGQAALFGAFLWIREGFWLSVGLPAAVASALLTVLVLLAVGVVPELRAAGRLRASRIAVGCVPVLILAAAAGFTAVPPGPRASVPAPVLFLVGALLAVVAWYLPEDAVGRWFAGRRAQEEPLTDDEAWLARLTALLRGRHGLSPAEAGRHVAEARDHLAASGGGAEQEFGRPEIYALRLAEGPGRPRRAARAKLLPELLLCAGLCWYAVDLIGDAEPASAWFWTRVAALSLVAWGGASALRTYWRGSRGTA